MAEPEADSKQKCPACGEAIEVGAIEPLTRVACPKCGERFRVERSFDHFEIVESLGLGGMGAVYKARDTRLERFVALKLLRKELSADPAEAARLAHEARMTAAVNHPHVIQVYSSGSAHGQIYLVMELVDHGSLDDLMAQKTRVPEIDVLRAGIQVARGLQAAHAKGLIHRDVKPANILFADALTAKIGDFGLAGAAEPQSERPNEIWGTPYYVAPERLNNEPEDFRSDIYSLGATLFHAIAGQPPIEGETTSAAELRELKSHPPDLQKIAPETSRETARVIHRMLAVNPAERFGSYAELVDEMVSAYGDVSGTAKKPRAPLIALVVTVAVLALAAGSYFLLQKPAPLAKADAANQTQSAADWQRPFTEARRLIVDGRYDQAVTAFTKLAIDAANRQPQQNWARTQQGLAALLQGKTGPARDAFQQLQPMNGAGAKGEEEFFAETKRALTGTGAIAANAADQLNDQSVQALALLLYGLKNWQLNEFESASFFLEKFLASDPPNEWKWINEFKPIAQKHVEDFRRYAEWKKAPENLETLTALKAKLQTRGALPATLGGIEKRLRAETTKRDQEAMKREQETAERAAEEKKRAFANDRVRYLGEWKTRLIADLQSGAYTSKLTVGNANFDGIVSADDTVIKLRAGSYGDVPTAWEKFPPKTLLEISKVFIKANAPDAAERTWLCAVFAEAKGLKDDAASLAESAAKLKSDYVPLRDLLLAPRS